MLSLVFFSTQHDNNNKNKRILFNQLIMPQFLEFDSNGGRPELNLFKLWSNQISFLGLFLSCPTGFSFSLSQMLERIFHWYVSTLSLWFCHSNPCSSSLHSRQALCGARSSAQLSSAQVVFSSAWLSSTSGKTEWVQRQDWFTSQLGLK